MSEPTYFNQLEQGSDEWLAIRCGALTASTIGNLFTSKGAPSYAAGTKTYALEKAAERMTEHVEPMFYTAAMARGHRDEEIARDLYSDNYAKVHETGFVTREFTTDGGTAKIGYSPDGLVGEHGLIEIKSRAQKYQMRTIVADEVPAEYMWQIQTGLLVTGRDWLDFISFCGGMALFVKRVEPDLELHAKIIDRAVAFETEVREYMDAYRKNACNAIVPPRPEEDEEMHI